MMQLVARLHSGIRQHHSSTSLSDTGLLARPRRHVARSTHSGNSSSSGQENDEDRIWSRLAFPTYLQSKNKHKPDVCRDFDKAVTAAERRQAREALGLAASVDSIEEEDEEEEWEPETVWHTIRREAERDAAAEPLLSSFLYASILAHDTFERALAFVLSNRLANAVMLPTQLFEIFHEVLISEPDVREGALADVEACRERDPACTSYSQALLYYKGYHAIQTHRIAHALWVRGQKVMAVALQSRMSEVLAVDIHPAARFGRGILLDHGTGVVIGETAIIGNNVSLLQNVTLGGTGKDHGDRHPKISDNVLIGACATVLGNIRVGEGAQIAAGSLVLKPVAPHTMVAGSPAKAVGHVTGNPAEKMQQWSKKLLNWDPFAGPSAATEAPAAAVPQQQQPSQPLQQQQQQPAVSDSPAVAAAAAAAPAGPSAVGGNGKAAKGSSSSSSSSEWRKPPPKATRAYIAAAEARWDAIAAQVDPSGGASSSGRNGSSSSASSNGKGAHLKPSSGDANGFAFPVSNGSSSSSRLSKANGVSQQQQPQQQDMGDKQWHAQSSAHSPAAAAAGETAPTADAEAKSSLHMPAAVAGRKQASADLRGIYEGTVEATLDEEVAAEKWAGKKEEPEYVI